MKTITLIFISLAFCNFIYPQILFSLGTIFLFLIYLYVHFKNSFLIVEQLRNKTVHIIGVIVSTFFLALTLPLVLKGTLPDEYYWILKTKLSLETILIIFSYSISEEFICRVWLEKIVARLSLKLKYWILTIIGIVISLHTFPISLLMVLINIDFYLKEKNLIFIITSNFCFRLTAFLTVRLLFL